MSPFVFRFLVRTLVVAAATLLVGCADRELRGTVHESADGGTHLVVEDDGAICPGLEIDGEPWSVALDQPGPISPGRHDVGCSGQRLISFEIEEGTTFTFDYWGP